MESPDKYSPAIQKGLETGRYNPKEAADLNIMEQEAWVKTLKKQLEEGDITQEQYNEFIAEL